MTNDSNQSTAAIEDSLIEFLQDIERDTFFKTKFEQFNIFEAIGMDHYEIRHSNALSTVFNPNSGLGVGDAILKNFLRPYFQKINNKAAELKFELASYEDAVVLREYEHIDLIIVSETNKQVFVIENKVKALELEDQLERYQLVIVGEYEKFDKHFIFLTPDGDKASKENWLPMSYEHVYFAIKEHLDGSIKTLSQDALVFLKHYLVLLERKVIEDHELRDEAINLYERHKHAIDTIIQKAGKSKSVKITQE